MSLSDNILTIRDLSFSFEGKLKKGEQNLLFDNLSLSIPSETITALTGGNGSGKTTLFNIINGLISGYKGDILFNGKNISGTQPYKIARSGIGRLFQGARVFEELSILDNLILGNNKRIHSEIPFYNLLKRKSTREAESVATDKAIDLLKTFFGVENDLLKKLHDPASELSFGQQRLLQLLCLLMGEYDLYLLDEPTSGVNSRYIEKISEILKYMTGNLKRSVFIIEHNMHFVKEVATYCTFLDDGKIIAEGSAEEVLNNQTVQLSYLGF